jgi:hypothetical protein
VAATYDRDLVLFDPAGQPIFYWTAASCYYGTVNVDPAERLMVSHDGWRVRFPYPSSPQAWGVFAAGARDLAVGATPPVGVAEPPRSAPGIAVDAVSEKTLRVNGHLIGVADGGPQVGVVEPRGERTPSGGPLMTLSGYAVSSVARRVLVAERLAIHVLDDAGKEVCAAAIPARCDYVNVSNDGRLIVGGLNDGTIRWYRMSDAREVLAFFPHADGKPWVMWTPSGYYDCSPGGEDLFGWHVNNGSDQLPDFYSASRFRGTYYRPDVITKVLKTLDEAEALRQANAEAARGFVWTKSLAHLLGEYEANRKTYPDLEAFFPKIVDFFNEYAQKK